MAGTYTEPQKKATLKYLNKLKSISIRVPEDEYRKYKEAAEAAGMPLRQFILSSMDEKIQREKGSD